MLWRGFFILVRHNNFIDDVNNAIGRVDIGFDNVGLINLNAFS
jgi:hypothetical protein